MSDDSDRKRALRVGLIAIVAIAVLIALLVVTGPLRVLSGKTVLVDFAYAGPIKPGASVRLSGVVIGAVQDVELLAGQNPEAGPDKMVRVRARIEERASPVVTDKSRFYVTTLGVLGEHYLDVEPAAGTPLADGARVDGVTLARADLLLPRAAGLLERADALLPQSPEAIELMRSMTSLAKEIDALLKNEGASDDVKALASDLRLLVRGAARGIGDGNSLRRSLDRLPVVLEKTEKLEDDLDQAGLATLIRDVHATNASVRIALERLNSAPLLDPEQQARLQKDLTNGLQALDAFGRRLDRVLGAIENKKGAAGQLFWDEAAADDLRAVLKGLRKDPLRFFFLPEKKDDKPAP